MKNNNKLFRFTAPEGFLPAQAEVFPFSQLLESYKSFTDPELRPAHVFLDDNGFVNVARDVDGVCLWTALGEHNGRWYLVHDTESGSFASVEEFLES